MAYPIANAPCSWGVEFGDDPRNPSWQSVLDDARTAGYTGMELGPLGFLPTDPAELTAAMNSRGLTLVGGVMFRPLHDPSEFDAILESTHMTCRSLQSLDARQFVLIDSISEVRVPTAGRPDEAKRLSDTDWDGMMDRIRQICTIARDEYGLTTSLHAHAAGFIEFEDEIDRTMESIGDDLLGLCIDTGHCEYARTDPVALYHRYHARVPYVHFKDVDPTIRDKVVSDRIGFYDACGMGLFCNLGDGVVNFNGFREALEQHSFNGWGTVEQDCDPTADNPVIEDARANYDFLKSCGLAAAAA